jgi:hypothetical protein
MWQLLCRQLPGDFAALDAKAEGGALIVTLPRPRDRQVRHFRVGSKVVLDHLRRTEEPRRAAKPAKSAEPVARRRCRTRRTACRQRQERAGGTRAIRAPVAKVLEGDAAAKPAPDRSPAVGEGPAVDAARRAAAIRRRDGRQRGC